MTQTTLTERSRIMSRTNIWLIGLQYSGRLRKGKQDFKSARILPIVSYKGQMYHVIQDHVNRDSA
jgi:hypothetical protein